MLIGLLAGLGSAVVFGVGAVLQARGVRRHTERETRGLGVFVAMAVREPLLLAVMSLYLLGFTLHVVAIWHLPLFLAQACVALALPVTAVSVAVVRETVPARQWLGVVTVVGGLILLAVSAGAAGEAHTSGRFVLLMWTGLAMMVALAMSGVLRSGFAFGAAAGVGYGLSAIAVRGVALPLTPLGVVSALAVAAFGLIAFWLYSRALDHAGVSAATAPLVVGETAVPTLVGLALLHDGVRPGWGLAVAAGLLLAVVGAISTDRTSTSPLS